MPDLCIFGLEFQNNIVIFEISTSNLSNCKIWRKKCLNLRPKMPYLGIFGLELKKKLLSYLKSAPSNLPSCEIL